MEEIVKHHDWWERHEGIDLWSVPHFLFGVLAALVPPLFALPFLPVFLIVFALTVFWEFFEKRFLGVTESTRNQVYDVALSTMAMILTTLMLALVPLTSGELRGMAAVVLLAYAVLNYLGWRAHQRRGRAESQT